MTSEAFARLFSDRLLHVARMMGRDRNTRWYQRSFSMGVQRIMFTGADEYEIDDTTQKAEVKPLGELIADMQEEAVDLMAYATMFAHREPVSAEYADELIALSMEQMRVLNKLENA